jgi:GNAT superfamily N-acetyltransferase
MLTVLLQEHGRYIYVFLLGTRPEFQGQGLGSALLQHVNAIADAEGMHCFLEVRPCLGARGGVGLIRQCSCCVPDLAPTGGARLNRVRGG